VYPIDIHSYAQAIVFFSHLGEAYRPLVERVAQRMIDDFQDPQGYFYVRQTKRGTVTIPYMRWSQAWAFHALTDLHLHRVRA
jgi:hypothetical protein